MTKKFDHLRNLTANIAPKESLTNAPRAKTAPILTAEATKRLHDAEALADRLQAQLKESQENRGVIDIPLNQLTEAPDRKRNLDEEQYNRLVENLRHNDLVTPIIVRKSTSGDYEIVSGHNRTQAFRDLGRVSIPALVVDIADETVNKDAFYANLLHSSLPDYEKYLGFQRELSAHPEFTHEDLARTSGYSLSHFSKIMAFGRLPVAAHEILKSNPRMIGAAVAQDLAVAVDSGKGPLVVKAIEMIARNELQQGQALKFISNDASTKAEKPKLDEFKIKKGKSVFCSFRKTQKIIRLEFKSESEADRIKSSLVELLQLNANEMR